MLIRDTPDDKPKRDDFERGRTHERRRLARELHDGVLQSLADSALRLDSTRKWLWQIEKPPPEDLVRSAEEIRASIRELREVLTGSEEVYAWRPGTLQRRLEAEVRELSGTAGMRIDLTSRPAELPPYEARLERELFFAAREALRNVARHSGATAARLELVSKRDTLNVSLTDNGSGFRDTRAAHRDDESPAQPHYGLKGIASRISELGGRISINADEQRGTAMLMSVPGRPVGRPRRAFRRTPAFSRGAAALSLGSALAAGAIAGAILLLHDDASEPPLPAVHERRLPAPAQSITAAQPLSADPLEISVSHYQRASDAMATGWDPALSPFERLDLSAWNYELIARKNRQEEGLRSRAFVYQHRKTGELLIAEEFAGAQVPDARLEKIRSSGARYATFSNDGVYSVAWDDNGTLCVLTSSLPENELVELAHEITHDQVAGNFE